MDTQIINNLRTSAPAPAAAALLLVEECTLKQLQEHAATSVLFAVVDATDQPIVPEKARELGERAVSLFLGSAEEEYWAVAPYLMHVDPPTLDWITENLWNEPWGIFAISKGPLESLRRHFRQFLLVQLPTGGCWYFRYYDPRILKAYLPVCNASDLYHFFGPSATCVFAYGIPQPNTTTVLLACTRQDITGGAEQTGIKDLLWNISVEQIETLKAFHRSSLITRLSFFLRSRFADAAALDEGEFMEILGRVLRRAANHAFETDQEFAIFACTAWMMGERFDSELPEATAILAARNPSSVRAQALVSWAESVFAYLT